MAKEIEPNQYPNIEVVELEDYWCGDARGMSDEDLFSFDFDPPKEPYHGYSVKWRKE